MIVTKRDGVRAADNAMGTYRNQIRALEQEYNQINESLHEAEQELRETVNQLAEGLLPSAHRAVVEQAAKDVGALHLPSRLTAIEDQRVQFRGRQKDIEGDKRYRNRELLIHPTTGDYSIKINEFLEFTQSLHKKLARYDFPDFRWLLNRKVHQKRDHGVFGSFWRMITLANYREEQALERVRKRFNTVSFGAVVNDYNETRKNYRTHKKELKHWQDKRQEVEDLVEEYSQNKHWLENYQTEARNALRLELATYLGNSSFESIHNLVRPAGKVMVAKCTALTKKIEYFRDLKRTVRSEINDREGRIASIHRVRLKWARKPYGRLSGDKSKWLVKVPKIKTTSTRKRVRWIRTMRTNIHSYHHYHHYSHYMESDFDFLPYDAFSYGAPERMPYEGFTRTVIGDLDNWRDHYGQERADFGHFKECLRQSDDYDQDWGYTEDMFIDDDDFEETVPDEVYGLDDHGHDGEDHEDHLDDHDEYEDAAAAAMADDWGEVPFTDES